MARLLLVLACVFGCLTFSHCQDRFGIVPGATIAPSTDSPSSTTVSTSAPTQNSSDASTSTPPTSLNSSSTAPPTAATTPSSTSAPSQASTNTSTAASTAQSTSAPTQTTTPAPTAASSTSGSTDAPTSSTTQSSTVASTGAPTNAVAQSADLPVEYIGQFESALKESQESYRMNRSNAQENQTLHLNSVSAADVEFRITICVKPLYDRPVMFRPGTFYYTNDGPSDTISIVLNEELEVTATTLDNFQGGAGWNQPMSFDFPEKFTPLAAGNHSVRVLVKTDQWGVDLDALSFISKNQDPDLLLLCDATLAEY